MPHGQHWRGHGPDQQHKGAQLRRADLAEPPGSNAPSTTQASSQGALSSTWTNAAS
nr:hypothetical protein [Pseudomonas sp. BIGb0427]